MKRKRYKKKKKDALNSENKTFLFFSFLGRNSVDSILEKLGSCCTRKFFWDAIVFLNAFGKVSRLVDLAAARRRHHLCEQELPALLY